MAGPQIPVGTGCGHRDAGFAGLASLTPGGERVVGSAPRDERWGQNSAREVPIPLRLGDAPC